MAAKVERRRPADRRTSEQKVAEDRRSRAERRAGMDRRSSVRAAMDLWVEEAEGEDLYFRRVGNLSLGGVYFENALPHRPGTRVTLKFSVPGHERIIETPGEVVNTTPGERGVGMGVRFLGLDAQDHGLLESYIAAVTSGALDQPAEDANG